MEVKVKSDEQTCQRVKLCERWHNGKVSSLHCHCRSLFRKFPSVIISTGEDSCLKFTRYGNTYLLVSEPWTLPCLHPITCSAKFGTYLAIGQQNGDVRLVSIRVSNLNSADEGKQAVAANIRALHSDIHRRTVTDIALSEFSVVVQREGMFVCNFSGFIFLFIV